MIAQEQRKADEIAAFAEEKRHADEKIIKA